MNPHSAPKTARGSINLNPPSRYDNPFATCWTRPGAQVFRFDEGQSARQLVEKLAAQRWWGTIVGPHGSGKSTLLETLTQHLRDNELHIYTITLRNRQRRLPRGFLPIRGLDGAIVVVDGYEQLGWLARARLKRHCRRWNLGIVVTTHSPTDIPTLIRLSPRLKLVQQLVADLASRVSTPISAADVAASHACHGCNVREIFFDLYDRHELLRQAERTLAAATP
jgi:hypothetical protein